MIEIRKFSECEFAPNILYEITKNETQFYRYLKVGGYIRGPNCDSDSIVGAYWENYNTVDEHFINVIKNLAEPDWKDKIFVKYDKKLVYETLYDNARGGYEHYLSIAKDYEAKMKRYEAVLNSL